MTQNDDLHSETLIGFKELVSLPEITVELIKCKVDTGAKTSALHAENIEIFTQRQKKYVKFLWADKNQEKLREIILPLLDERMVKSSTGISTKRPVIKTKLIIGDQTFEIELTLIDRHLMGYKMLLGREAMGDRFLIAPHRAYLTKSKLPKKKSTKK